MVTLTKNLISIKLDTTEEMFQKKENESKGKYIK